MSTKNLDERNLALAPDLSLIHEDVMDKIYDLSPEDKPFTDSIGRRDDSNHYVEWVNEVLEAANPSNKKVDGQDLTDNEAVIGNRFGNYHQIATKTVKVSDRGRNSDTIGSSDELVRQLVQRQKALRRDVEAAICSCNVAMPGAVVSPASPAMPNSADEAKPAEASQTAGIGAWIHTNNVGPQDFAAAAFSGSPTGGYPKTAATAGTAAAGTEANVRAAMRMAYMEGGNPTLAMSAPQVIEGFSSYLFTSSARVATLQSNAPQGNRIGSGSGNGVTGGGIVAQGSVNLFVTDYGTLELVPNRFQPNVGTDNIYDLYLIDTDYWELGFLQGYQTKTLARTGLAENRVISVDFALIALAERSSAAVRSIDSTAAWTA